MHIAQTIHLHLIDTSMVNTIAASLNNPSANVVSCAFLKHEDRTHVAPCICHPQQFQQNSPVETATMARIPDAAIPSNASRKYVSPTAWTALFFNAIFGGALLLCRFISPKTMLVEAAMFAAVAAGRGGMAASELTVGSVLYRVSSAVAVSSTRCSKGAVCAVAAEAHI